MERAFQRNESLSVKGADVKTKSKMKKIILALSLTGFLLMLTSCDSGHVEGVVRNLELNQSIELYKDGRVLVRAVIDGETIRQLGTYKLSERNTNITIYWDNGEEHRGRIDCRDGSVSSMYIEGIKFENVISFEDFWKGYK